MNNRARNLAPTPGNWRNTQDYGVYAPNNNEWTRRQPVFPRSLPFGATENASGAAHIPWSSFEETVIRGPLGLTSFPVPARAPLRILVLEDDIPRLTNPRTRPSIPESPPGFIDQRNVHVPLQEDSRLTQDEQKKALNKLKKEIYNPTPKKLSKRVNLYYRDNASDDSTTDKGKEKDDDGKRCAICLDDFEPKEVVTLTPCKHMFHEDCIVPWVKSHGQCPVCRSAICDQSVVPTNTNTANVAAGDPFTVELVSIVRAMDEVLARGNLFR